jgi:hypothetical protein
VRTYDSKLVSREMHRLGSLAYLPNYVPNLTTGTSSTTLVATSSITPPNLVTGSSGDNPWGTLHVLVLPLFNGEPLRIPMCVHHYLVCLHPVMTYESTQRGLESAREASYTKRRIQLSSQGCRYS